MMILSVTKLKLFEACRMAYKFKYVEGLEPVVKAEALQTGSNYHELIEHLYKAGTLDDVEQNSSKELAMARAYEKYVYPQFKVKAVEEWFECELGDSGHKLTGRVDGVAEDGRLVEHKTTGADDLQKYEFDLQWDEQILAYMLGYGVRRMWYTIIRKPTIRIKKNESDEEFYQRMIEWYDEDTDTKIKLLDITRTDEEVEEFRQKLKIVGSMMDDAEQHPECLYRNTAHCNCWGRRCEYSSICLNYDPSQQYIEFKKRQEEGGDND